MCHFADDVHYLPAAQERNMHLRKTASVLTDWGPTVWLLCLAVYSVANANHVTHRVLRPSDIIVFGLGALVLIIPLVWAVCWFFADKWVKTSLPSVLFLWFIVSMGGEAAYEELLGGPYQIHLRGISQPVSPVVPVAVILLVAMLLLRDRLRRRWKASDSIRATPGQREGGEER
jgi:hypothetical protein